MGFSLTQLPNMTGWPQAVLPRYSASNCSLSLYLAPGFDATALNSTSVQAALFRVGACFAPITPPAAAFTLSLLVSLTDECGAGTSSFPYPRVPICELNSTTLISGVFSFVMKPGDSGDVTVTQGPGLAWVSPGSPITEGMTGTGAQITPSGWGLLALSSNGTLATDSPISGCRMEFLSGSCSPEADTITLPAAGASAFATAASALPSSLGISSVSDTIITCGGSGAAGQLQINVQAPGSAYAAWLSTAAFRSNASNALPASAWRQIAIYCGVGRAASAPPLPSNDTTGYALLQVAPLNDPAVLSSSSSIALPENAPPLVEVTVARACSGRVSATMAGTGICFADPDPITNPSLVSAGAGAETSFYAVTLASPLGSALMWTPVGAVTFDCSVRLTAAALSPGGTPSSASAPCWRRLYQIAAAPLDFEALPAAVFVGGAVTVQLALNLTDTFAGQTLTQFPVVTLSVTDVDDPAFISWADTAHSVVYFNESSPDGSADAGATGAAYPLTVRDQDIGDRNAHTIALSAVSPPDGSPLLLYMNASQLFVAVCNPSLTHLDPIAATWVEGWTLMLRTNITLDSLPAKSLVLNASVTGASNGSLGTSIPVPVRITRANNAPSLGSGPGATPLNLSIAENSPPGTPVAEIFAYDADTNQALSYSIISSNASVPGLFTLVPVPRLSTTNDTYTGAVTTNASVPRSALLLVAVDALDYEMGDTVVSLLIAVTDDGALNSSVLPAVPRLSSSALFIVSISDISDAPSIDSVSGVPAAGADVSGGMIIYINGRNVGLSAFPASPPRIVSTLVGGTLPFGSSPSISPALNCSVSVRQSQLVCVLPPGAGTGYAVSLSVSGQSAPLWGSLDYESPRWMGAQPSELLPTSGNSMLGSLTLSAVGVSPSLPISNLSVSLIGSSNTASSVPGCVYGASSGSASVLSCGVPEGAGRGHVVRLGIGSTSSVPSLLSYAPPVITLLEQPPPNATAQGGVSASATPTNSSAGATSASSGSSSSGSTSSSAAVTATPSASVSIGAPASISSSPSATSAILNTPSSSASPSGGGGGTSNSGSSTPWWSTDLSFRLTGTNLGTADTLDWVRYSAAPSDPLGGCGTRSSGSGSSDLPVAQCGVILARACTFTSNHTVLVCTLDQSAFGMGFYVQISVGGQTSNWSKATLSYPAPIVTSADLVVTAASTPDPSGNYSTGTTGGSFILISGASFTANTLGLRVTVGGVAVLPLTPHDDVATVTAAGTSIAGPSIMKSPGVMLSSLLLLCPPGFGKVTVSVWVGNRSAAAQFSYGVVNISVLTPGTYTDARRPTDKAVLITGIHLSQCALQLSVAPNAWPALQGGATCALPNEYVSWLLSAPGAPPPPPALAVYIASGGVTTRIAPEDVIAFATGDAQLSILTNTSQRGGSDGSLLLVVGPASSNVSYSYDEISLSSPAFAADQPVVYATGGLSTSPGPGALVTLNLKNAGQYGTVFVELCPGSYSGGGGPSCTVKCPIVWSTLIYRANPDGTGALLALRLRLTRNQFYSSPHTRTSSPNVIFVCERACCVFSLPSQWAHHTLPRTRRSFTALSLRRASL